LRGYSDYVEAHGDLRGVELLERYRQLIRAEVTAFNGAEIRTEGDSFYIVFPSASAAVSCAMGVVARAAEQEPPIRVGIGVHAGEAADTGEGPVGSAVNIAARVCAQAAAGEVLVTDTVRAVTRTVLPFSYVPRGTPQLKGIAEPIALFSVMEAGSAPAVTPRRRRPALVGPAILVGVILVLGVVAIGAVIALNQNGASNLPPTQAPTSAPPPTATTQSSSTVQPSPTSPLATPEADLVARFTGFTSDELDGCRSATPDERAEGATVSVACDFPAAGGASQLRLDQFDVPSKMLTAFSAIATAHGGSSGDCASSPSGYSTWNVPRVSQGTVLCYPSGGDSYIVWTYEGGDGAGIMGTANRHDVLWQQLYAWWQFFHPLVNH